MHRHALNQSITLYRAGTLSIEQAARHAGVRRVRMETALRAHGVSVHERSSQTLDEAATNPMAVEAPTPDAGPLGNPPTGAD